MVYHIVYLRKAPDLQLEDTFGVRTGKSLDEALGNLESAIRSHLVRHPPEKYIIYVYPVSLKSYEAALTDNSQYAPTSDVVVRDRRRERS